MVGHFFGGGGDMLLEASGNFRQPEFSAPPAAASVPLVLFSHTGACSRQLEHGPFFESALLVFVRMAAFPCVLLVTGESSQGHKPLGSRGMTSVFPVKSQVIYPPNLKPFLSALLSQFSRPVALIEFC